MEKPLYHSKVMVVSNQRTTGPLWVMSLQYQLGLNVAHEPDPVNAVRRWAVEIPDLIILDVHLPNEALISLIKDLRCETPVPILLLTSDAAEEFLVSAYAAGIDECILNPIGPPLFHAKVKVWLHRSGSVPAETLNPIQAGDLQIIPGERLLVMQNRSRVRLTSLELRLLYSLMSQPGRPLTADSLVDHVWGADCSADTTALKNIVYRLRQKIESDPANPKILQTVPGVGYRFSAG